MFSLTSARLELLSYVSMHLELYLDAWLNLFRDCNGRSTWVREFRKYWIKLHLLMTFSKFRFSINKPWLFTFFAHHGKSCILFSEGKIINTVQRVVSHFICKGVTFFKPLFVEFLLCLILTDLTKVIYHFHLYRFQIHKDKVFLIIPLFLQHWVWYPLPVFYWMKLRNQFNSRGI